MDTPPPSVGSDPRPADRTPERPSPTTTKCRRQPHQLHDLPFRFLVADPLHVQSPEKTFSAGHKGGRAARLGASSAEIGGARPPRSRVRPTLRPLRSPDPGPSPLSLAFPRQPAVHEIGSRGELRYQSLDIAPGVVQPAPQLRLTECQNGPKLRGFVEPVVEVVDRPPALRPPCSCSTESVSARPSPTC